MAAAAATAPTRLKPLWQVNRPSPHACVAWGGADERLIDPEMANTRVFVVPTVPTMARCVNSLPGGYTEAL